MKQIVCLTDRKTGTLCNQLAHICILRSPTQKNILEENICSFYFPRLKYSLWGIQLTFRDKKEEKCSFLKSESKQTKEVFSPKTVKITAIILATSWPLPTMYPSCTASLDYPSHGVLIFQIHRKTSGPESLGPESPHLIFCLTTLLHSDQILFFVSNVHWFSPKSTPTLVFSFLQ